MHRPTLFFNHPQQNQMKKLTAVCVLMATSAAAFACPFCNNEIKKGIYNSQFYPNLFSMMSAFIVLGVIVAILSAISSRRHRARQGSGNNMQLRSPVPLTTAAMVLGIGLGGFLDGIVLHQLLQFHEMLSNKIPSTNYVGKSVNMFWDGIFHFFCLMVVLIGVILMWKLLPRKDVDRSGKLLGGGLLAGWGLFNITEGVIDHQVLKLHNVVELANDHTTGNMIFLGISVVMLIAGFGLINSRTKSEQATSITKS